MDKINPTKWTEATSRSSTPTAKWKWVHNFPSFFIQIFLIKEKRQSPQLLQKYMAPSEQLQKQVLISNFNLAEKPQINPNILALSTEFVGKLLINSDRKWQITKDFVYTICEVTLFKSFFHHILDELLNIITNREETLQQWEPTLGLSKNTIPATSTRVLQQSYGYMDYFCIKYI